jgi:hypothetical protein
MAFTPEAYKTTKIFRHNGKHWRREVQCNDKGPYEIYFYRVGAVTQEDAGAHFGVVKERVSAELFNLLLISPKQLTRAQELELTLLDRNCLPVIRSYLQNCPTPYIVVVGGKPKKEQPNGEQ